MKVKSVAEKTVNRRKFIKTSCKKSLGALLGLSTLAGSKCKSGSLRMPKRILGRTGLEVSLLGFGCTQVKDQAAFRRAIELGVNYFHMGDRDPSCNRAACEVLVPFRKDIYITYMSFPKNSSEEFLKDLENFLQQSGFGYLDVWFAMTPGPDVLVEFIKALAVAKQQGKVNWSGMTTHSLDRDVVALTNKESPIDVVMMSYNYLSPPEFSEILGKFHKFGLGITPMKPLAGKFYEQTVNRPDALIRWLASDKRIHSIPIIMTSAEQVEQNVAAILHPFTEQDRQTLSDLYSYNSNRFCRMCGACIGQCPKGLAVSDLVRTAMYMEGYQNPDLARSNFRAIPSINRRISCDDCDRYAIDCPNGVAVKERLSALGKMLKKFA